MRTAKKPLPLREVLSEKFTYADGRLISRYSGPRRRAGHPVGRTSVHGYRVVKLGSVAYYEHRLIWMLLNGDPGNLEIDHINGIRADNRVENLRLVTPQENNRNLRSAKRTNRSGLLGASYHTATGKYRAQIRDGLRYRHIGVFDTAEEAHLAYMKAKSFFHGAQFVKESK